MSLKLIKKSEDRKKKTSYRFDIIYVCDTYDENIGTKKNIDKSRMKKPTSNCI